MAKNLAGAFALTVKEQHHIDLDQSSSECASAEDLIIIDNRRIGLYEGVFGRMIVGGVVYKKTGNCIMILGTSVFPNFRDMEIPPKLLNRILEEIRAQGRTVAAICPYAAEFITAHPEYADLLDPLLGRA
ncbi:N-acetyltransferase [Arthrobacter sp. ISL-85]|uniref:GNAT family N-acetyltransferase n=1 Tax=Arthrobacter sp. ISL-85 TaxID=2819115 RepID=UPI001BE56875|nr:N-acetyltransferase [Arthrobacter sp. ISL-85]MBT2566344.1 N-acetyltransferase [Arthrobacter sp. ISL-85]